MLWWEWSEVKGIHVWVCPLARLFRDNFSQGDNWAETCRTEGSGACRCLGEKKSILSRGNSQHPVLMPWAGDVLWGVCTQSREGIHSAWRDWGHSLEEAAKLPSLTFTIQLILILIRGLGLNHARTGTSNLLAFASVTFSARTSPLSPTPLPDDPL